MAQLNLNISPEFEEALKKLMRLRKINSKSEAIRIAVQESLNAAINEKAFFDFSQWLGLGKEGPGNKKSRFKTHDDLWR